MNVGIDFGNTHCRIGGVKSYGIPAIITDPAGSGQSSTPNDLILDDNCAIVGRMARLVADRNPDWRLLHYSHRDIQKPLGPPKECGADAQILAALLLKKLRLDVESIGASVSGAVIAVPSWLNSEGEKALALAASMADVPVIGTLEEGVAAAIYCAYVENQTLGNPVSDRAVLVVDVGETSTKTTVLDIGPDRMRVLGTSVAHFGGRDISAELAQIILDRCTQAEIRLTNAAENQDILSLAEDIKLEFCRSNAPFIYRDVVLDKTPLHLVVLRTEMEEAVSKIFERLDGEIVRSLSLVGIVGGDIHTVLLSGGSFECPFLVDHLRIHSQKWTVVARKPRECICLGATLHANDHFQSGVRDGSARPKVAIGVRTFDPETGEGKIDKLVDENEALPDHVQRQYFKWRPTQTRLTLELLELRSGESLATSLGQIVIPLDNLPNASAIDVAFDGFDDGVLRTRVSAPKSRVEVIQDFQIPHLLAGPRASRISAVRSMMVVS